MQCLGREHGLGGFDHKPHDLYIQEYFTQSSKHPMLVLFMLDLFASN